MSQAIGRIARQRARPVENRWIGQRIDSPAVDLAGMARAQGAVALGPVQDAQDLLAAFREAVSRTRAGSVVVVDVHVAAEYDESIARTMVRGSP